MRIAYFPLGDRNTASSRLRVWKIADVLAERGHDILLCPNDTDVQRCNVAVVQKRMDLGHRMQAWRSTGTRVVWDIDDHHSYSAPADLVTVGANHLRELYPDSVMIPDALDVPAEPPIKREHSDLKRVCWFGISANLYHAARLCEACEDFGLELTAIIERGGKRLFPKARYVDWSLETVDREIIACDLVACPYLLEGDWPAEWVAAKGENRVLKAWALGMPVIGTGIDAYVNVGLTRLASTREEWVRELRQMESASVRQQEAKRGQEIAGNYTAERIASQWLEVFS